MFPGADARTRLEDSTSVERLFSISPCLVRHLALETGKNRLISVYRPGEMPIQSCGQSVSALHVKAGARLNAHTELRAKRQRIGILLKSVLQQHICQPLCLEYVSTRPYLTRNARCAVLRSSTLSGKLMPSVVCKISTRHMRAMFQVQ